MFQDGTGRQDRIPAKVCRARQGDAGSNRRTAEVQLGDGREAREGQRPDPAASGTTT